MMNSSGRLRSAFLVIVSWIIPVVLFAQPAGYYSPADGKTGTLLQQSLHDIIDNHTVRTYASLWTDFQKTDKKADGTVWDMYSDKPGLTPAYVFIFGQNQCGNYSKEGDCYNREHSFPKSWFGGEIEPMYTDLNHLVPTDGWVNNQRGNYPFGVTNSPTWTSTNGSKVGPSAYPGYVLPVFEPINAYKGDFARIILYMALRYFGEDAGWPGSDMVTGSQPKEWALKMLMEWNTNDPVSQKEKDRNDSVFIIQGNRNPFIDNMGYVNLIWGLQSSSDHFKGNNEALLVYPNPANDHVTIDLPGNISGNILISITDISGRTLLRKYFYEKPVNLDLNQIGDGFYIITIRAQGIILRSCIVVSK
jgi:endonuclease I